MRKERSAPLGATNIESPVSFPLRGFRTVPVLSRLLYSNLSFGDAFSELRVGDRGFCFL